MLRLLSVALASVCLWISSTSAFGLKESGNSYIVDTSGGLVFTVDKTNGDVTSLKFNDVETQGTSKNSHISSGIGASCSYYQGGNEDNYIVITCTTSTLIQYYVGRYKDPALHMATYTTAEPSIGELRFIARLNHAVLSTSYTASTTAGSSGAIEGSDVFTVNGQTRSKFYSSRQFIDDQVHGPASGGGVSAWMIIPGTGYEGSSGGPFFRDINNQNGDGDNELYFYMNSGHTQTESNRQGLHGPYALWFTTGSTPSTYDASFWEGLSNISGLVPTSGRGRVTGKASGYPSDQNNNIVVGWSNSEAQYWVRANSSGNFVSPYMKPGTYTMTLYRVELAIGSQSVSVNAGGTVTSNISSSENTPNYIWKIGDYDGTPRGFLNADKIETMHPSDSRMSSWGPITYSVGNSVSNFPMAAFKDIGSVTINFSLSSSQIGARTLQIATTLAFAGGRPKVTVNGWDGPSPSAPSQPDSRGVTRGTWRGNNVLYTVNIPSGTLVSGSNKIVINVISGSSGSQYLSPNFVFDSIWLY